MSKLVYKSTGEEVREGDEIEAFQGDRHIHIFAWWSGRRVSVYADPQDRRQGYRVYYPAVFPALEVIR